MPTLPADIINRALDECGIDEIGDLQEGSTVSKAAIRVYEPTLRQMLSAAHWNFARKEIRLTLLGDVTGQYVINQDVPSPWAFMYDWPVDCVHARYVPSTDNTVNVNQSIFGTPGTPVSVGRVNWAAPAPFIVSSSDIPNDPDGQWYLTEGHDPEQTRVVLTNQVQASLIYTGFMQYPDAWDPLFEQAMVAALAARLAMPLIKDRKEARVIRADNIQIAKQALDAARVRDGDEGWTGVNHTPDWIRARTSGGWGWNSGVLGYPWMSFPMLEDAGGVY